MTSVALQELIQQTHRRTYTNRMPAKAERLANAVRQLDEQSLERLRAAMSSSGFDERMARRAGQAAPSSVIGAIRIIDSMAVIFGKSQTLEILRKVGYDKHLAVCIRRFANPKRNRSKKAQELFEHLLKLFGEGDPVLEGLSDVVYRHQLVTSTVS